MRRWSSSSNEIGHLETIFIFYLLIFLLCYPGWSQTSGLQWFSCFSFPSAGTPGTCHCAWPDIHVVKKCLLNPDPVPGTFLGGCTKCLTDCDFISVEVLWGGQCQSGQPQLQEGKLPGQGLDLKPGVLIQYLMHFPWIMMVTTFNLTHLSGGSHWPWNRGLHVGQHAPCHKMNRNSSTIVRPRLKAVSSQPLVQEKKSPCHSVPTTPSSIATLAQEGHE
jgi:hypothetical protein